MELLCISWQATPDKAEVREAAVGPSLSFILTQTYVVLFLGNVGKDYKYRAFLNEWIRLGSAMANVTQESILNVGLNSCNFKAV